MQHIELIIIQAMAGIEFSDNHLLPTFFIGGWCELQICNMESYIQKMKGLQKYAFSFTAS
jgi:hypothetical protein